MEKLKKNMPTSVALAATGSTEVEYGASPDAWMGYMATLRALIRESGARRVLELGGGANPALLLDEVHEHGLDYSILDIAQSELDKAPAGYHKIQGDVGSPLKAPHAEYDFIFSKMLAEHLQNGRVFHENVLKLLRPGGVAFHFFPTLYAPPFLANWLLPERLATWVLQLLSPRDSYQHAKFPAFYSWCRGPSAGQLRRFEQLGYEVCRYTGFFGHDTYYSRIPLVRTWHRICVNLLLRHPVPQLTSFAYVVVRKPAP
jgi:2-polyprenyl-3-methyl-5-hydroxy-6-metoxy-1,4-benzoquinol methylase